MATLKKKIPKSKVIREVYRNYITYKDLFSNEGTHIIDYGYYYYDDEGERRKETITISIWDLQHGISEISQRKREAVFYNVIIDMKQEDVARKMNITTVTVGQYVDQAMTKIAERYFAEEE